MKETKDIFFDLDHTLWDFDANSAQTISELFKKYSLFSKLNCSAEDFFPVYLQINNDLWHLYDHGKISKEELRITRFQRAFENFNYSNERLASQIDEEYILTCPIKGVLLNGAVEVLQYLKARDYNLHIVTNGFKEIQSIKLNTSNILAYFSSITTGECAKANKPSNLIFDLAFKRSGANLMSSVFIGDNPQTDIVGAKNYGMKTIWYNSRNLPFVVEPDLEIQQLKELQHIF